jgi:hypothetical protein
MQHEREFIIRTSGKLLTLLQKFTKYSSISERKTERYQHITGWWSWKHRNLDRLCPKISPDTGVVYVKQTVGFKLPQKASNAA